MRFETWMFCEKLVDDGGYTIGYVDGKPAQWDGKNELLEGEDFRPSQEGQSFGVNSQNDYVVEDGVWVENTRHGGKREGSGRKKSKNPRISRHIKFTDAEWEAIREAAVASNVTMSDYVRKKVIKNG